MNPDDKLRRIERIASSASWQERAMTPQLFTWFCAESIGGSDAADSARPPE